MSLQNGLKEEIDIYVENHTSKEDECLEWLRRKTYLSTTMPRQISGKVQGKLLKMLSLMIKPKYVFEIGTFTGYSAYCLKEGLLKDGMLHTIEIREEYQDIIEEFLERANASDKITLHIGDAMQIIKELDLKYDLILIDGDKRDYPEYYKVCKEYLNKGGYMLIDNTLWYEKVLMEKADDKYTLGIQEVNDIVVSDPEVECVMLPLRDGLTLVRKLV